MILRKNFSENRVFALWPYAALTISMLFFASNHILGRVVTGEVPPIGLSFWRWVLATLILIPFTWRSLFLNGALIRVHWKLFLQLTISLVILGNTSVYIALQYTTAINAGMVSMAQPVVTILLTWILFRETVIWSQKVGAVIAGVGVIIVLSRGNLGALADVSVNIGDIWMVVSVFGFTTYAIYLRKLPKDLPPLVTLNIIQFLGIAVLLPFYLWETTHVLPVPINQTTFVAILWAGVVVAIGAMFLWNLGNQAIGANKASAFVYLRLMMITVLAMIILGEKLALYHVPSFALIVTGVYLVSRAKRPVS